MQSFQFMNYTCQVRYFSYACLRFKCFIINILMMNFQLACQFFAIQYYRNSVIKCHLLNQQREAQYRVDQGQSPSSPKLSAPQVVSLLYGHHFSDHASIPLYIWQRILGPLDGAYTSYYTFSSVFFCRLLSAPTVQ